MIETTIHDWKQFTAKKALDLSLKRIPEQVISILKGIRREASLGKREYLFFISGPLDVEVIEELEDMGYSINSEYVNTLSPQRRYAIRW